MLCHRMSVLGIFLFLWSERSSPISDLPSRRYTTHPPLKRCESPHNCIDAATISLYGIFLQARTLAF